MKYFTLELLEKSSDMLDSEYEIYDKLWMENLTTYWSEFKNYEDRLPSRFVKEYCKHAFHDYNIESINLYNNGTKRIDCYSVELKISYDDKNFLIRYTGVTKYNVNLNSINYIEDNTLLYNEILPVDDAKMSHEILLVNNNIVYIEFRKISFKKVII